MSHVEEFFDRWEVGSGRVLPARRVYLAADNPDTVRECKDKYGHRG